MSAASDVLRVEHIAKRFGPVTALRDINLHLKKGEVLGLLGARDGCHLIALGAEHLTHQFSDMNFIIDN